MQKRDFSASGARKRASRSAGAFKHPAWFVAIFAVCFCACHFMVLLSPIQTLDAKFTKTIVQVSYRLIKLTGGAAKVEGAVLRNPVNGFAIEMMEGCNGVDVTILLWSAVIAFPSSWKPKLMGLSAGALILQSLNLVRFISLYYIGQYSTSLFNFVHHFVWETLLILDTLLIFWLWANYVRRTEAGAHIA